MSFSVEILKDSKACIICLIPESQVKLNAMKPKSEDVINYQALTGCKQMTVIGCPMICSRCSIDLNSAVKLKRTAIDSINHQLLQKSSSPAVGKVAERFSARFENEEISIEPILKKACTDGDGQAKRIVDSGRLVNKENSVPVRHQLCEGIERNLVTFTTSGAIRKSDPAQPFLRKASPQMINKQQQTLANRISPIAIRPAAPKASIDLSQTTNDGKMPPLALITARLPSQVTVVRKVAPKIPSHTRSMVSSNETFKNFKSPEMLDLKQKIAAINVDQGRKLNVPVGPRSSSLNIKVLSNVDAIKFAFPSSSKENFKLITNSSTASTLELKPKLVSAANTKPKMNQNAVPGCYAETSKPAVVKKTVPRVGSLAGSILKKSPMSSIQNKYIADTKNNSI